MPDITKLYNGQGVVAMPSQPINYDKSADDGSVSSSHSRYREYRSRSRSRGRGSNVSRSRDIVQEVYDKMGVNYVKGQPSIDGYTLPSKSSENPGGNQAGTLANTPSRVPPRPITRGRSSQGLPPIPPTEVKESLAKSPRMSVLAMKDRIQRMSLGGAGTTPTASNNTTNEVNQTEQREEAPNSDANVNAPDDERDATSVKSSKSSKSVKERIGMYRANTIKRSNSFRHSYGSSSNGSRPPKVNIYDSPSLDGEGQRLAVEADIDQSSCIGGTRNANQSSASASRLSVGDAFLSAINKGSNHGSTPNKNIPFLEIPNCDFLGNDTISAASSVSGDDFMPSSPKKRGKQLSSSRICENPPIEKQIDLKISYHLALMTKKFEAEIRRVENRLEQECKRRIEALEKQNKELLALLKSKDIAAPK